MVNYIIPILFISFMSNIFLAGIIMSKGIRQLVNVLFILIAISVAIWSAFIIGFYIISESDVKLLIGTHSSALLVSIVFYYFSLNFPEKIYRNVFVYTWPLVVFFPILYLVFFTDYIVGDRTGIYYELNWGYPLYQAVLITYFGLGFTFLAKQFKESKEVEKKLQIKYVLGGAMASSSLAIITNLIFPYMGIFEFTWLGPVFTFILVFSTFIAIVKHRLFSIKIIATETLVFTLWSFLLIRTIFSVSGADYIINGSVLFVTVIVGIFLIRSVIHEVKHREETDGLNKALTERKNKLESLAKKLQEANLQLKDLMKVKTEFLQIASHQLRTPLTSLRGFLSMQAEGDLDKMPEKERKSLHKDMVTVADNLNNIVNDLLHATELDGGSINFEFAPLQVQDLIEEAIKTFQSTYKKKGLTITFERNKELPEIEADEGYIRQVFLNIINNAEKYMKEGGLTITCLKKDSNIEMIFTDTGIGIDPEDLENLFGKFVRGKKAALIHTDGSGLGLYIIKKIVEEHGGTVALESEGLGKGTTVRVVLPIKQS